MGFIDRKQLKILKRMRKVSNSVQALDFSKADFVSFRQLMGGMPWQVDLKGKRNIGKLAGL